jgi:hypothetical protein
VYKVLLDSKVDKELKALKDHREHKVLLEF